MGKGWYWQSEKAMNGYNSTDEQWLEDGLQKLQEQRDRYHAQQLPLGDKCSMHNGRIHLPQTSANFPYFDGKVYLSDSASDNAHYVDLHSMKQFRTQDVTKWRAVRRVP